MPTKQEILEWMKEDTRLNTPYEATLHFNITIEEFYKITKL